jgi:hypothetical protein
LLQALPFLQKTKPIPLGKQINTSLSNARQGFFCRKGLKNFFEGKPMLYASNIIERIIRDLTELTATEKLVAITLASYADRLGMEARPPISRLVKDTKLSRRCIFKTLKSLKEKGVITATDSQCGCEAFSTVYKFNVSNAPTRAPGAPPTTHTSAPSAPKPPILPQETDFTRAPGAPHPFYIDNNIYIYNQKNDSVQENSPVPDLEEKFEEWWKAYPRQQDKRKAYAAFCQAIKQTDFETLLKKAKAYARMRNKAIERQPAQEMFTKAAHNWLGNCDWVDNYGKHEVEPSTHVKSSNQGGRYENSPYQFFKPTPEREKPTPEQIAEINNLLKTSLPGYSRLAA